MKAILIKEHGGPEQLYLGEAPEPEIKDHDIRVKVKATAINRADTLQRQGSYPPPPGESHVLGLEMAGEVDQVGPQVKKWKVGDRVFALLGGGGYAEYVAIHEDMAMPIPSNVTDEEAAGIAEVYLTAYQALTWIGKMRENQTVLIHAGASGVGTAGIQLAKLKGCQIIATAGSEKKLKACQDLGADVLINYKESDFSANVLDATSLKGADIIIDFVGASYLSQNFKCIALDGTIVLLALLGGPIVKEFPLHVVLRKRINLIGSTLRTRDFHYKTALTQDFVNDHLSHFESGQLKAIIDCVIPWEKAGEAHEYMEANKNIGKIILKVQS